MKEEGERELGRGGSYVGNWGTPWDIAFENLERSGFKRDLILLFHEVKAGLVENSYNFTFEKLEKVFLADFRQSSGTSDH